MTSALLLSAHARALYSSHSSRFAHSACIAPNTKKIATTATAAAATALTKPERMMIASFIPSIHLTLQFTMNFSAVKFNFLCILCLAFSWNC